MAEILRLMKLYFCETSHFWMVYIFKYSHETNVEYIIFF